MVNEKSKVVSQKEWLVARKELLAKEKELSKQRDAVTKARGLLPMVKVDKSYDFDGPDGKRSLLDLFRQALAAHRLTTSCSIRSGRPAARAARSSPTRSTGAFRISARATSRSPRSRVRRSRSSWHSKREWGGSFPWLSSLESDFNFDFHVSFLPGRPEKPEYNYVESKWDGEAPGLSVFCRDGSDIFHTYSTGTGAAWKI